MRQRPRVLGIMFVAAVAATGCAGKVRVASATRCQAHGGTYDTTAKSCTYKASTQSAQQTCQSEGGYYDSAADYCELGN